MSKLNKLHIEELKTDATRLKEHYPFLRYGQSFFILLETSYPDIANSIRGSIYDPFHFEDISKCETYLLSDEILEVPIDESICNNILNEASNSFNNIINKAIDNYSYDSKYKDKMREYIRSKIEINPVVYK